MDQFNYVRWTLALGIILIFYSTAIIRCDSPIHETEVKRLRLLSEVIFYIKSTVSGIKRQL